MTPKLKRIACLLSLTTLAVSFTCSAQEVSAPPHEGINVGGMSGFRKLVPAEALEQQAAQQYEQLKQDAAKQQALAPDNHPQTIRLRSIANKIIPFALPWNERAPQWQWEINLIGSKQVNAFCMPGGKIAFYSGILTQLKLTDDEIAMVMGHEIAHALREHARERNGKGTALNLGANLVSQLFGLGNLGNAVLGQGAQLWMLKFSREDESEADSVGLDIAARAGYDPRAALVLWQKMSANNKGAPPQWMSTHPSDESRMNEIRAHLPEVLPLYAKAVGKNVNNLPEYKSNVRLTDNTTQ
ncbi:M48 family metallopeptidase [Ampullimonas aquatilis]|uniref:M48 family metallopeptidase n=1 Tax=Ampullimonas aquatilis TaxID=1341549 RepID=UPI003C743622